MLKTALITRGGQVAVGARVPVLSFPTVVALGRFDALCLILILVDSLLKDHSTWTSVSMRMMVPRLSLWYRIT